MTPPEGYKETSLPRDWLPAGPAEQTLNTKSSGISVYGNNTCRGKMTWRRASVIKIPNCKHKSFCVRLLKSLWDYNSHACLSPAPRLLIENGHSILVTSTGCGGSEGISSENWQTGEMWGSRAFSTDSVWAQQTRVNLGWSSRSASAELNPKLKGECCGFYNPMMQWLHQLTRVLSRCFLLIDKELRLVFDR